MTEIRHCPVGTPMPPIGTGKEGFYGTTISGLTAGQTYYYRIRTRGKLNPKGISGSNLKLWLDAEDTSSFVLNGSEVVSWKSKSGQPYDFDQKTGDPKSYFAKLEKM